MAAHTKSIVDIGLSGIEVNVECHLSKGLPTISIVGLAGKAVDESKGSHFLVSGLFSTLPLPSSLKMQQAWTSQWP
jgi:hypothetical protein